MRRFSVLLVLLMGCGRVLGFDDYELADVGIDASDAGDAGDDAGEDTGTDVGIDAPVVGGPIRQVALGSQHTCAMTDGHVYCWGSNLVGQLGSEDIGSDSTTPRVVPIDRPSFGVTALLAAGHDNTCVVAADETVTCWGDGADGELGEEQVGPSVIPIQIPDVTATQVVIGQDSMCAITTDRDRCASEMLCWGNNDSGRLGRGTAGDVRLDPGCVAPQPPSPPSLLTGRDRHYCGVFDRTPWCWGINDLRQVQDNPSNLFNRPVQATGNDAAPVDIRAVAVGRGFSCALDTTDEVRCWGGGAQGQLGDGLGEQRGEYPVAPIEFAPTESAAIEEIAVGEAHACARDSMGNVYCWGQHQRGRLGLGETTENQLTPARLDMPPAQAIALGGAHGCAISTSDQLWCWGTNPDGRVGNGGLRDVLEPALIELPAP